MTFKLLIDECLSPELVTMAVEAGHVESSCLRDRGWLGLKDWELIERVVPAGSSGIGPDQLSGSPRPISDLRYAEITAAKPTFGVG